jgi:PilZ domain
MSIHSKIFEGRAAQRHQLIWKGILRQDGQSTDVRIRNISQSGAMIESHTSVPLATELLLELGESVSISATVEWARGHQLGLRFQTPFDMSLLARARPVLATGGWEPPAYLAHVAAMSVYEKRWTRRSPVKR